MRLLRHRKLLIESSVYHRFDLTEKPNSIKESFRESFDFPVAG